MKTIREELIEVRNRIDELINLLGTETEVTSTPEEPLENIIFNTKLFNTPEKLFMEIFLLVFIFVKGFMSKWLFFQHHQNDAPS